MISDKTMYLFEYDTVQNNELDKTINKENEISKQQPSIGKAEEYDISV
jgi:hypothetical protein